MSGTSRIGSSAGFTLLEMVVALLLLSILSVMTFQGVEGLWRVDQNSRASGEQNAALQRAWQVISSDMLALRPRLFADGRGGWQPAFETGAAATLVRFTRAGEARLSGNPSGLARVNYLLQEGQLWRYSWPATSSANATESRLLVLDDVHSVSIETLAEDNRFTPNWPPINEQLEPTSLPRMIRIELVQGNGERTSKLLPGVVDAFASGDPLSGAPNG